MQWWDSILFVLIVIIAGFLFYRYFKKANKKCDGCASGECPLRYTGEPPETRPEDGRETRCGENTVQ